MASGLSGSDRKTSEPFHVAVIWDGGPLALWQVRVLEQLARSARIAGIVGIRAQEGQSRSASSAVSQHALPQRVQATRATPSYLFRRFIDLKNGDSLGRLQSDLPDFASVVAIEEMDRHARCFDFVLDFSGLSAGRALIGSTVHGVWEFRFGARDTRAPYAVFWAMLRGASTAFAYVVRLAPAAQGDAVLRYACIRIGARTYRSIMHELFRRCVPWAAHLCEDLQHSGEPLCHSDASGSEARDAAPNPPSSGAREAGAPANRHAVRYLLAYAIRRLHSLWRDLFRHEQWNVGVVEAPIASVLTQPLPRSVRWLPQRGRADFIADCFGIYRDGALTLLCEYLHRRDAMGRIVSVCVSSPPRSMPRDIGPAPVEIGPTPAVHLSYPFLLEADGRVYCVPETHEASEVSLYEAAVFPSTWKKSRTLLAGIRLVDATLFRHAELWWLAASEVAHKGSNCELHLWYAKDLGDEWSAHAQNPVKTDVRSARPGGTPFVHEGALYRPAQDCAKVYGGRVSINRIERLTPFCFAERAVGVVEPDARGPYPDGLHTLSAAGPLTLIDSKRIVFIWQDAWRVIRWMLRGNTSR